VPPTHKDRKKVSSETESSYLPQLMMPFPLLSDHSRVAHKNLVTLFMVMLIIFIIFNFRICVYDSFCVNPPRLRRCSIKSDQIPRRSRVPCGRGGAASDRSNTNSLKEESAVWCVILRSRPRQFGSSIKSEGRAEHR